MALEFGVIYEVQNIVKPSELPPTVFGTPGSDEMAYDPRPNGQTVRRKSVSSKSKEVVTIDQIRPDWEDKLNAVKAAAARRASRRIIMQRVGDRLIPVGYTSSRSGGGGHAGGGGGSGGDHGPITTDVDEEALAAALASSPGAQGAGTSGRRRRSRFSSAGNNESGIPGANDLEEMMIMEAMRLSLLEHEEQQRKEAEAKKKKQEQEQEQAAQGAVLPDMPPSRNVAEGSSSPTGIPLTAKPSNNPDSGSSSPSGPQGRPRRATVTFSEPPTLERVHSPSPSPLSQPPSTAASTDPTVLLSRPLPHPTDDLINLESTDSVPQVTTNRPAQVTVPTNHQTDNKVALASRHEEQADSATYQALVSDDGH